MGPAEGDHVPEKAQLLPVLLQQRPVQPGGDVVLTVGVVVAELGVAELVPGQEHGDAPAAHEQGEGAAHHPPAQGVDGRVGRGALRAAVPAVVVVCPVGVVPAVFQVVLLVVGEEVPQGEAVVAGDEVHRGVLPPGGAVDVPGAHHPLRRRLGAALVPLEVAAYVVPVAPVPLRPAVPGREGAHLVEPPGVPRLGDELHVPQDGVKGHGLEQGRLVHGGAVLVAPEYGGQIEPEPVHPVGGDPVAQAVHNHLVDHGVVAVEGVAAAAEVVVPPVRGEQVVDVVVKALEGEEGPLLIALGGVVEHHVQIDLDPPAVAVPDEVFQLVALPVILGAGGVAGVGGEEADGIVPPVVAQLLPVHLPVVLHLVKLEDGHQLDGVHTQALQIGHLLHQPREGARVLHAGGRVPGKAPHMELVDDQVLHGDEGLAGVAPVEVVLDHPGLVVLAPGGGVAPPALAGDGPGVGVQQVLAPVEDEALVRLVGPADPVGVLEFLDVQLEDNHGVHVADAVVPGKGQHVQYLSIGRLHTSLTRRHLKKNPYTKRKYYES